MTQLQFSRHPRLLVGIPTLHRYDLLIANHSWHEEWLGPEDGLLIIDNGGQSKLRGRACTIRPKVNMGVAGSWNYLRQVAFGTGSYDGLVILQDDIAWGYEQQEAARRLLVHEPETDLFISYLQFAVQVCRPHLPPYADDYYPAWCEDCDYMLELTKCGFVYARYHELDPAAGSIFNGSIKPVKVELMRERLAEKWHTQGFRSGEKSAPWYETNRHFV